MSPRSGRQRDAEALREVGHGQPLPDEGLEVPVSRARRARAAGVLGHEAGVCHSSRPARAHRQAPRDTASAAVRGRPRGHELHRCIYTLALKYTLVSHAPHRCPQPHRPHADHSSRRATPTPLHLARAAAGHAAGTAAPGKDLDDALRSRRRRTRHSPARHGGSRRRRRPGPRSPCGPATPCGPSPSSTARPSAAIATKNRLARGGAVIHVGQKLLVPAPGGREAARGTPASRRREARDHAAEEASRPRRASTSCAPARRCRASPSATR